MRLGTSRWVGTRRYLGKGLVCDWVLVGGWAKDWVLVGGQAGRKLAADRPRCLPDTHVCCPLLPSPSSWAQDSSYHHFCLYKGPVNVTIIMGTRFYLSSSLSLQGSSQCHYHYWHNVNYTRSLGNDCLGACKAYYPYTCLLMSIIAAGFITITIMIVIELSNNHVQLWEVIKVADAIFYKSPPIPSLSKWPRTNGWPCRLWATYISDL